MKWLPSYLQRSKSCLLDVRIDTYDDEKRLASADLATYTPIIQLIADHFERVQYFFWFARKSSPTETLYSQYFKEIAAPALERFRTIASERPLRSYLDLSPSIFAGGAPRLSLVDLVLMASFPPLQNVTTMMLEHRSPTLHEQLRTKLAEIASSAPNLMHFSIGPLNGVVGPPQENPVPCIFKSLQSLKLTCSSTSIAELLGDLEAPQLESLWFNCSGYLKLHPLLSQGKLSGKFPSLRYLTLQVYDFPNLNMFARAFPSVTHLHLPYPRNGSRGLTSIISDPSEPIPWPNLHTLAIQTIHDAYSGNSALLDNYIIQCHDFISYRRRMNNEIKTLLFDRDLFKIAASDALLNEVATLATISRDSYKEYWWNLFEGNTLHMIQ